METKTMKTIGLLGGMSPESTVDYYQRINSGVNRALGGYHSARMVLYSADLQDVFTWFDERDEAKLADHLTLAAIRLEGSGADFVIMACNTAHVVAPQIEDALSVPFLHIADVLGSELTRANRRKIGLLGSTLTMNGAFYRDRLWSRDGIEVMVPDDEDKREVDRVIREELCHHRFLDGSLRELTRMASELRERGADALVLGCTELGLILEGDEIAGLPVFDTTALHCERAVSLALGEAVSSRELAA